MGCYVWYSDEGTGRGPSPPRPLIAVPNVTAHPSTANVPITVLLYNDPWLCGFNVPIKGLRGYLSFIGQHLPWSTYLPTQIYVKLDAHWTILADGPRTDVQPTERRRPVAPKNWAQVTVYSSHKSRTFSRQECSTKPTTSHITCQSFSYTSVNDVCVVCRQQTDCSCERRNVSKCASVTHRCTAPDRRHHEYSRRWA